MLKISRLEWSLYFSQLSNVFTFGEYLLFVVNHHVFITHDYQRWERGDCYRYTLWLFDRSVESSDRILYTNIFTIRIQQCLNIIQLNQYVTSKVANLNDVFCPDGFSPGSFILEQIPHVSRYKDLKDPHARMTLKNILIVLNSHMYNVGME